MVFLRPKVVRTPEQAQEMLDEVDHKAPLVKQYQYGNQQGKKKGEEKSDAPRDK
jgi:hypothetical protein